MGSTWARLRSRRSSRLDQYPGDHLAVALGVALAAQVRREITDLRSASLRDHRLVERVATTPNYSSSLMGRSIRSTKVRSHRAAIAPSTGR